MNKELQIIQKNNYMIKDYIRFYYTRKELYKEKTFKKTTIWKATT